MLDVNPIVSVSPTWGLTSSTEIPNVSANCIAEVVRVPPISADPSIRFTVPSGLTVAIAVAGPVPLNQNPEATPRPVYLPFNGAE